MSALPLQADQMLAELIEAPRPPAAKPAISKVRYTHEAMIDLVVSNPWISQNEIAAHFGYTPSWVSTIFSSDAFQAQLAARRDEIVDPAIKATVEERFRALVIQSLEVLKNKLSQTQVSDNVALRAAELGAKALGIGGHAAPPAAPPTDRLEKLAERLIALQGSVQQRLPQGVTYEAQAVRIEEVRRGAEATDTRAASATAVPAGNGRT